jgi:hypothetical protein
MGRKISNIGLENDSDLTVTTPNKKPGGKWKKKTKRRKYFAHTYLREF